MLVKATFLGFPIEFDVSEMLFLCGQEVEKCINCLSFRVFARSFSRSTIHTMFSTIFFFLTGRCLHVPSSLSHMLHLNVPLVCHPGQHRRDSTPPGLPPVWLVWGVTYLDLSNDFSICFWVLSHRVAWELGDSFCEARPTAIIDILFWSEGVGGQLSSVALPTLLNFSFGTFDTYSIQGTNVSINLLLIDVSFYR